MNSQMGAPGIRWVGGGKVGRGDWVTVLAREESLGGMAGALSRASEGKLSAVQPGFSLNLSAFDVPNKAV